jgi:hypothetical protein
MTFFHFLNCITLASVPHLLTYKYSGLAEYSAFWKLLQTGFLYLFMQFLKMMVLATFFPVMEDLQFNIVYEFFKTSTDVCDLIGIHLAMTRIAGKCEIKYLIAAAGWSGAELVMTKFFPLWVGARGVEFDWKYVQLSLDSNISLAQHIVIALFIYLYNRNDTFRMKNVLTVAILLCLYRPFMIEVLAQVLQLSSWSLIASKAMFTASIGLFAMQIFYNLK